MIYGVPYKSHQINYFNSLIALHKQKHTITHIQHTKHVHRAQKQIEGKKRKTNCSGDDDDGDDDDDDVDRYYLLVTHITYKIL